MGKIKKVCQNCGSEYDQCPSCEKTYSKIYFAWRTKYCSTNCFKIAMGQEDERKNIMRIEYNKKTYTLKGYNLATNTYTLPDDTTLKASEISSFIMSSEEFTKVLKHVPAPTKTIKKVTKKTEEAD